MAFDREKAAAGVMLFGPLGAVLGESKDSKHNDGGKTSYIANPVQEKSNPCANRSGFFNTKRKNSIIGNILLPRFPHSTDHNQSVLRGFPYSPMRPHGQSDKQKRKKC